ncbi:MAG TPA: NAD(P)/FAD-dependent oxidoreductase, partial [Longimicrobiales bacterium]|nr:NAD(P)/FAD-dependent oxidoreductase [Longimicrobiales bacterium]
AGLAVSSCLTRIGVPHVVFERERTVAAAWRRHYDRLHLHTSRGFSSLPHHSMPPRYPRYPSRDQVVNYLEADVRAGSIDPKTGVNVRGVEREGPCWLVDTTDETIRCRSVVVATGAKGVPRPPEWPGLRTFPGSAVHSSDYRNGMPYSDQDVLVVRFENSGGEIALDLLEHGARPMVSVRSPVNLIPRDILGTPVLAIAIPLSKLPARLADILIWPLLRAYYPSYSRLGLRRAAQGPFRQIEETGRIPLLDVGTIREIRRGRIQVASDVREISGSEVRFVKQKPRRFDAIVFATGYRPCVPPGLPQPPRGSHTGGRAGLYFCGFHVSPTGMLREIGIEARRIAADIAKAMKRDGSA